MKLTIFIATCMAIMAVQSASVPVDHEVVDDKAFMEMQMFMLQIVYQMDKPLADEKLINMGKDLNTDKSQYMEYTKYMGMFFDAYKVGDFLPQGDFFSAMQRMHVFQSTGLFHFFYYAKNWETMMQNMAWARMNVNEGMFMSAMHLAVIHRPDMQGIILPQIYEILPQMFFSSKYIMAAKKFDWDTFNRQIMLEKELKSIYEPEKAFEMFGNSFYMKDWKMWQWWKLMGLDDSWKLEGKSMLMDKMEMKMMDDPLWASISSKLKMVWMPADYTRDISIMNDDSRMSYFTEDVGWNAYWYYLNMDYSWTLGARASKFYNYRRGEWWMFNAKQMLTRYYMERLSQGLGEFPTLSLHGIVKAGYDPQLIAYNGNGFSFRKNYWEIETLPSTYLIDKIMNIERRLENAIDSGEYVMKDGTVIDMKNPQSIEFIGKVMQGSFDFMERDLLGYWFMYTSKFLSGQDYLDMTVVPNVLMNFETMMRDPMFYSMLKRVHGKMYKFQYQLQPYKREELMVPGVKFMDVEVSKLMTYYKLEDFDVTTLHSGKMIFIDGMMNWDKSLMLRQKRLYSKSFYMNMTINAEQEQKAVISVFLAPEFDNNGMKLTLIENRENFMLIDKFITPLSAGKNVISRNSEDFTWTAISPPTYSKLYNYAMMSMDGKHKFQKNISPSHSKFPANLILPHGWVEGMPMSMFFMISPYTGDSIQEAAFDSSNMSGIGSGMRFIDYMPFGYPLDRKIDNGIDFVVPNMFYKQVKIYHLEKFDKYYPMKYEHFGSFDEDY